MVIARMIIGIDNCASVMRMMTRSHHLPLKPGEQAEAAADDEDQRHGDDADHQRILQADQAAHQHVAAELVRAERVNPLPFVADEQRRKNLSFTIILVALIGETSGTISEQSKSKTKMPNPVLKLAMRQAAPRMRRLIEGYAAASAGGSRSASSADRDAHSSTRGSIM